MKTTLLDLCSGLDCSIKEMKHALYKNKQQGNLFIKPTIFELASETEVKLYFDDGPGESDYEIDAFPIPIDTYRLRKEENKLFETALGYFEKYYKLKTNESDFISNYDLDQPYIGIDYVWFYKSEAKQ